MGEGAIYAFAAEMGFSFDDAEEILYGHRSREPKPSRPKCPICGRKCGGGNGVAQHMKAVHTAPRLQARVAEALRGIGGAGE